MNTTLTVSLNSEDFTEVSWIKNSVLRICIDLGGHGMGGHGIYMSEEQALILARQLSYILANKPGTTNVEPVPQPSPAGGNK